MTTATVKPSLKHSFPKSTEPLPREDEVALIRRWQLFGDNDARSKVVEANVRFVFQQCLPYRAVVDKIGLDFDELVQEGVCALLVAIDKFDCEKKFKFITYAVNWVRQHIREFVYRNHLPARAPASVRALVGKYFNARKKRPDETHAQIVDSLNLTLEQRHNLDQALQPVVQLDAPAPNDEGWACDDGSWWQGRALLVVESPFQTYEDQQMEEWTYETVQEILNEALNHYELGVVKMYFGLWNHEPMTLEEIGKLFNVTRERVRQVKARALARLAADERLAGVFAQLN